MTVCFFGHRETLGTIRQILEREIEELIRHGADRFFVGNQGGFDAMVLGCLRIMAGKYPQISYWVVLAYMPKPGDHRFGPGETILPEGIEMVHPKFAIAHRNKWMAQESDAAVVYVAHGWGGAAKYAELMAKKGKIVINLWKTVRLDQVD